MAGLGLIVLTSLRDQPVTNVVLDASIKSIQSSITRVELALTEIKLENSKAISALSDRVRELELENARRSSTRTP